MEHAEDDVPVVEELGRQRLGLLMAIPEISSDRLAQPLQVLGARQIARSVVGWRVLTGGVDCDHQGLQRGAHPVAEGASAGVLLRLKLVMPFHVSREIPL
jgi:hypothetical protein